MNNTDPGTSLNKLEKIVTGESKEWIGKANFRKENEEWLDRSFKIALHVLSVLRSQNITQKMLAEKMGVSFQYVNKIVKGGENLSLETISKIERALGIQLITVNQVDGRSETRVSQTATENVLTVKSVEMRYSKATGSYRRKKTTDLHD